MPAWVRTLRLAKSKKRQPETTNGPTWEQVESILRGLSEGTGGRVELSDARGDRVMTIYGSDGEYCLGIATDGSSFHFYINGTSNEEEEELCEIAWNQVPKTQVLKDVARLLEIVKRFYETGERVDTVQWLSERF